MTEIFCKKCNKLIKEKADSRNVRIFDVCIDCTTLSINDKNRKEIRKSSTQFRNKKMTEVFNKENPSEMEINIINKWAKHYGPEEL